MTDKSEERLADFLFELGTMRKIMRIHRQTLLTDDMSDNIASHSFRAAMIGWLLAQKEGADPYKVVMMCLLHDFGETRSNDHNWVHKRYTKVFDEEIIDEQYNSLPFPELKDLAVEYKKRESVEAIIAKEADLIDQILLLKEYEWQGNKEAAIWLHGKDEDKRVSVQIKKLHLESAKELAQSIYDRNPSDWWGDLWTNQNR